MGYGSRALAAICSQKHQFPFILKVLLVMAVFLGFTFFVQGAAALDRPIVILNLVIIGGGIVFFGAAVRYCAD